MNLPTEAWKFQFLTPSVHDFRSLMAIVAAALFVSFNVYKFATLKVVESLLAA